MLMTPNMYRALMQVFAQCEAHFVQMRDAGHLASMDAPAAAEFATLDEVQGVIEWLGSIRGCMERAHISLVRRHEAAARTRGLGEEGEA